MSSIALNCHPSTPCDAIRDLTVEVLRTPGGVLTLGFALEGTMACLRIPDQSESRRVDGLWQHTCCEAFITAPTPPGYYELNFSPSTEWAIYRFEDYRQGMTTPASVGAPTVGVRRARHRLELAATVDLGTFPEPLGGEELRLALSAVIEEAGGRLSFWALTHPPGKPDFHHRDAFVLRLPPPGIT